MPNIEFQNVNVTFKNKEGTFHILKDVSLKFPDGKVTAIIGQSGCGKTTLVKSILGLIQYEGNILFDDQNLANYTIQERTISYVGQNFALFPNLTIFNNIAMPLKALRISGEEIRRRVYEVAEMLHISECLTRKPKDLSIGQCQRAAIARAIVKKPNAFIFDEPFSNLDEELTEEIIQEMKEIFTKYNSTVIFVCHNLRTALIVADNFVVMDEGKIIATGNQKKMVSSKNPIVKGYFATV